MVDMLHPGSRLDLLMMEGVAPADLAFADGPETYLGADLTEYIGGTTFQTAERIVLVQAKYSAVHPGRAWTMARLTLERTGIAGRAKPGTSVLRKLANMFAAAHRAIGDEAASRVSVRLHTNQPLDSALREDLLRLREHIAEGGSPRAAGRLLKEAGGPLVERLHQVTQLGWAPLAAFLRAWDLDGFGQAMLSAAEAEVFAELDRFIDGDVPVGNLISFVQEHCQAGRRTDITRPQVYALLRLREENFFPAPSLLQPADTLFLTRDAARLMERIEAHSRGVLVLEGRGGSGKSSTIQVAAREYAGGAATIIYDCYADGAGLRPGTERYPYKICFVQIINELEARFDTRIHATTRLGDTSLLRRFTEAAHAAARVAESRGHRLVIAVDAIDNAADAAERSPVRAGELFVPLLWTLEWPHNCVVVVSTRPENVPLLKIPADLPVLQTGGFTREETEHHVAGRLPEAPEGLAAEFHERTRGNPRVQSRVLEALAETGARDALEFVRERARATAFEFYQAECLRRIRARPGRLLLAVIHQATQFLPLAMLAGVLGRDPGDTEAVVRSLAFGLRLTPEGTIVWQDQEFLDFVAEFVGAERGEAREILAVFCLANHGRDTYARQNLARHLHLAERHDELLRWCLDEGRLEERIREVEPHGEDALADVEYALLSAAALGRTADALALLALAADIVQGRNLFVEKLWANLPVALAAGYTDRLLDDLGPEDARSQLRLALALAEADERSETARDLLHRAVLTLEAKHQEEMARRSREAKEDVAFPSPLNHVFTDEVVLWIMAAIRSAQGFRASLESMQEWSPPESIAPIYAGLCQTWREADDLDPVGTIRELVADPLGRCFACLGLLDAPGPLNAGIAEAAAAEILASIAFAGAAPEVVRKAILGLLRCGHPALARQLLPHLIPENPRYGLIRTSRSFFSTAPFVRFWLVSRSIHGSSLLRHPMGAVPRQTTGTRPSCGSFSRGSTQPGSSISSP